MRKTGMPAALAALVLACIAPAAQAGEGGGSSYNGGVENFLTGAAPPPGFMCWGTATCTRPAS